ncbi:hypothetical protein [Flavobacterium xanthum]|uniref:Uncharacterized protein n=1 Tax=Flavobacterium xanthum TaxID=69322 RepID=A0A1M7AZV7_9FLAO|nr:hypothetical protein [Flavobacterium xanthum]SHL48288.1 hypothetical protein SAMN05443669_100830 [Flavobacterium xanthum]
MKKLVFTALAVVAFSGVAMAGTQEVKVLTEDCQTKAMNYIDNVYDPNGTKSPEQNYAAYQGYLQACDDAKTAKITAN